MASYKYLRSTGFEEGHVSKDGLPEPVLFYQLPYISEDGINTPDMLERLYELRDYARHNIDTVVSVGIGGSYLGSKVILMCNVEHFGITTVQRNATAILECTLQALMWMVIT